MSQSIKRINDNTLRMPVALLRLGMFVCKLDRPWLGTPFLMQGFLVRTQNELETLKQICDTVYVDTAKSLVSFSAKERRKDVKRIEHSFSDTVDRDLAVAGLKQALPTYSATAKVLRSAFRAFVNSSTLDSTSVHKTVESCLDQIVLNTSAMAWLSRVKSHTHYTYEHSMHVSLLAMVFAVHCGWTREEAKAAGVAGLVFDIGKLKIPSAVLTKPGPLTESEWELVRHHTKWTRYYLEKSGFTRDIIEAGYYHHERPDGAGYPVKRVGGQTPQLARLIHVLDAFDAMVSYRPYAQQKTVFEATKVLYRLRNIEFDSDIVDKFIEMLGVYPIGTIVELSSGEVAIVIGQNDSARLLPVISVIRDRNKNPMPETVVNLANVRDKQGQPRVHVKTMLHDGSFGIYMHDYTRQLLTTSI